MEALGTRSHPKSQTWKIISLTAVNSLSYSLSFHDPWSSRPSSDGVMGTRVCLLSTVTTVLNFPGGSDGKASAYSAGDLSSIPGLEDPLEKEMATHSSILAWKIPWTEERCRLQCMRSQRDGHD